MDTVEEEWFVFLNFAQADLSLATRALSYATDEYPPFVQYCVLRDAVVTYVRPFRTSRARHEKKGLKLLSTYVPDDLLDLHQQMLLYRDKAYAHTDLDARNPRLHCWTNTDPSTLFIQLSPVDRDPLHFKKDKLKTLFDAVHSRVAVEIETLRAVLRAQVERKNS